MLINVTNWANISQHLKTTFLRFPLPVIFAFCASIVALLLTFNINVIYKNELLNVFITLLYASIAFTSLKLFVESHGWSLRAHGVGALIILFIIVIFTWNILIETNATGFTLFSISLFISLIFAPYINKKSSADSYWYFNYILSNALFIAALAALILGSGLSIILLSVNYLFEITIPNEFYALIWVFGAGILFTIYFLSNISTEFDFAKENCSFPKGISFITNYILVPLMVAYMAILYAYFFKILIQWQLPRGNLAWIITAFGSVGIASKLLAYPIRHEGTRLLQLFDQYYYYVLIVPIILLAVVIGIRINDYGITESRYIVVLLGLWFSIVTILAVIKQHHFHIKYVPMVFALLAFFASFGPWGAFQMSINSQVKRFESTLIEHGLLVDGQAVKVKHNLSFTQSKSLSSMANYLTKTNTGRKQIEPWFQTLINKTDTNPDIAASRMYSAKQLIELMGIEYAGSWQRKVAQQKFNYSSGSNNLNSNMFNVTDYDYISAGTVYFHRLYVKDKKFNITVNNITKIISIGQQGETIVVTVDESDILNFDMEQVIVRLKQQNINVINSKNLHFLTLNQSTASKHLNVKILIERITGTITATKNIDIRDVHYIIMLQFNNH